MERGHHRMLPSTRKLIARVKRAIAETTMMNRALEAWLRTPPDQRPEAPVPNTFAARRQWALRATVLCCARAHMRGRAHGFAGNKHPVREMALELQRQAIEAYIQKLDGAFAALIRAALAAPARERVRMAQHTKRLGALEASEAMLLRAAQG